MFRDNLSTNIILYNCIAIMHGSFQSFCPHFLTWVYQYIEEDDSLSSSAQAELKNCQHTYQSDVKGVPTQGLKTRHYQATDTSVKHISDGSPSIQTLYHIIYSETRRRIHQSQPEAGRELTCSQRNSGNRQVMADSLQFLSSCSSFLYVQYEIYLCQGRGSGEPPPIRGLRTRRGGSMECIACMHIFVLGIVRSISLYLDSIDIILSLVIGCIRSCYFSYC